MQLLNRTETTGHDLLGQQQEAASQYLATLAKLQSAAEDRAQVVEARLQELEVEKLVLTSMTNLSEPPALHDPTFPPIPEA